MRALLIDDTVRAAAAKVIAYAEAHPYRIGDKSVPGDNPLYVLTINQFRCVFSFTQNAGKTYRHLSVSVPGTGYPHPAAVFMLADLFGMTGWDDKRPDKFPDDWSLGIQEPPERCAVVIQEVRPAAAMARAV